MAGRAVHLLTEPDNIQLGGAAGLRHIGRMHCRIAATCFFLSLLLFVTVAVTSLGVPSG